jgi:membrane protein YdbS with pleckstrin-like domain
VDKEERETPEPKQPQQPPRRPPDPPPASVSITPVPVEDPGDTAVQRPVRVAPVVTTVAAPTTQYDSAGLPIGPPHIEPTTSEPSRIVSRYLFDGEKYCGEWRRHWIYVARWTSVGVISPFLVGYLVGVLGDNAGPILTIVMFAWLALLIFVGYKLLDWYYDRFVLTDKRVMTVGGLITRRVGMMPLPRVTDMAYTQSPLGRVLNYGTFVLESAGQDQALREIKPLPRPGDLYLLFCQEMYDPGRGGGGEGD